MKNALISLTKQQVIWLKDLIHADIIDWQSMAARPIDEVGVKFAHLAKVRIENMNTILAKLDVLESVETLRRVRASGLVPEFGCNIDDILAVIPYD